MTPKPIIYLDVDDTILRFPPRRTKEWWEENKGGAPAYNCENCLKWLRQYTEVRWLTAWTGSGTMRPESLHKLASFLKVPVELISGWDNHLGHHGFKPAGIEWETADRMFWIEDGIYDKEYQFIRDKGYAHKYYYTHASIKPWDLHDTICKIADVLRLPHPDIDPKQTLDYIYEDHYKEY